MRALVIFVSALAIFVAYVAATTERREPSSLDVRTTEHRASETAATMTPPAAPERQPATIQPRAPERTTVRAATTVAAQGVTVQQAAARIAASGGRPSIVLLYGTQCPLTRQMFADFAALARRHPEVEILAFATSEDYPDDVPNFLQEHGAAFAPIYIREWAPGALTQAMAPLGIHAGATWTRPLLALRDASGRVVAQGQGMTNVAAVEQALLQLR